MEILRDGTVGLMQAFSKLGILVALLLPNLFAQTPVIEDFTVTTPASISQANPAVVDCGGACGFNMREFSQLNANTTPQANDTVTLGSVTYKFVSSFTGAQNEVLIGADRQSSMFNLMHAVNADGWLGNANISGNHTQTYSATQVANPDVTAGTSQMDPNLIVMARNVGPNPCGGAHCVTTTSSGGRITIGSTTTHMEWVVVMSGGTGAWSVLGTDLVPKNLYAVYKDSNHYELYTSDFPLTALDTSGGSFAGGCTGACASAISIERGVYGGTNLKYIRNTAGPGDEGNWANVAWPDGRGNYQVTVFGCPDNTKDQQCAQGYDYPETVQIGNVSQWQTLVSSTGISCTGGGVSGGTGVATCTVTLSANFPTANNSTFPVALTPGRIVMLRNVLDTAGSWTYTVSLPNSSNVGTTLNQLVKYDPGTNTVRGVTKRDVSGNTGGFIGVATGGAGTTGNVTVAIGGLVSCMMSTSYTAGNWAVPSGFDSTCMDYNAWQAANSNPITAASFPLITQGLGVIQTSGSAGTTAQIWWNHFNRGYVVQSTNESCTPTTNPIGPGNCTGTGVTQFTIQIPGVQDGNYGTSNPLVGEGCCFSGPRQTTANATTNIYPTPYVLYGSTWFFHQIPELPVYIKKYAGFNPTATNRLNFNVYWRGLNNKNCNSGSGAGIGSYVLWPGSVMGNNQGDHKYNQFDPYIYGSNSTAISSPTVVGPMYYSINWSPSHSVGISQTYDYPANLTQTPSAQGWHGALYGFWQAMGTFYQDLSGPFCDLSRDVRGQALSISPVTLTTPVVTEPDELVKTVTAQWTSHLFKNGDANHTPTGNPGYAIGISVPHNNIVLTYEYRYSLTGSLHTSGFSSGLCSSTGTTTCGSTDRITTNGVTEFWTFPSNGSLGNQNIWWGIKPISIPVGSTTGDTQSPIWISLPVDPQMQVGDHVTVAGVLGNTHANVTNAAITGYQPRQGFFLVDSNAYPYASSTATSVTFPSNPGGPIKVNATEHGLQDGQQVEIRNVTTTVGTVDGIYTITLVDGNNYTLNGTSYNTNCPCSGLAGMKAATLSTLINITSDSVASPGTTCTVNLTTAHNMLPGMKFDLVGSSDSHLSPSDGIDASTYTVSSISGSCAGGATSCFEFACPANTPTSTIFNLENVSVGGVINNFMVITWPAISVAGTGNGSYGGNGTLAVTPLSTAASDDLRNFTEIFIPGSSGAATTGTLLQGASPRGLIVH